MIAPDIPFDEASRLLLLNSMRILDSAPEEEFDRITRVARQAMNVQTALVSLIDTNRQWFKSRVGLEVSETPRDISFCGHAILSDELFVIGDAQQDPRFFLIIHWSRSRPISAFMPVTPSARWKASGWAPCACLIRARAI